MPGFKGIAVPPNPSTRLGQRRAAARVVDAEIIDTDGQPSPALRRVLRPAQAAVTHRYGLGERLRMRNGGNILSRAAAECTVKALLPYEGRGAPLYRVQSDTEQFERVVNEGDLSRQTDEP